MLITKSIIKEYGLFNAVNKINNFMAEKREFVIDLSDGEIYATPYDFCTWYDKETETETPLMFHDYNNIINYFYDMVIKHGSKFIEVFPVDDGDNEPEFID